MVCADEVYFYLTLSLNKQNNRIWSDSRPLEGKRVPLHDQKVLVWCAISAKWGFWAILLLRVRKQRQLFTFASKLFLA